ncbi:MAG: ferritin [Dehalococcoidia bacterium]
MPAISKSLTDAFNSQINKEIYSAYLYLSMSSHCDAANLPGAAGWLRIQWEEELGHATKLLDYVNERSGRVVLKAVDAPAATFGTLLDIFRQVRAHEEEVTASINKIYQQAISESDYAAQTLLQWYVNEQVEEENSAAEIISMLELAGDSGSGLLMVDRHLAGRARGA